MDFSEFEKVKICKGTRWSSSYYMVTTQGLQPNKNGYCIDCEPLTVADLIKNINSGQYSKECNDGWQRHIDMHPDDKQPLKNFASSIYPFKYHRYTLNEYIYDEQLNKTKQITTLYAYKEWTGFIGYDFDAPKIFTQCERRLIGKTLKEILANNLKDEHWFIGSLISTGGNGTHCLTAVKVPDWYYDLDVNEMQQYHHCVWWYILKKMLYSLFELPNELSFINEDQLHMLIDECTLTVNQTINISPIEEYMIVNPDFKYIEIKDITKENYQTYFDNLEKDILEMSNDIDELFLKVHGTSDDICKSDKFKKGADINFKITPCETFDIHILDNCKGPWHFEHKRENNNFWTGNQVIHTLLHFFNIDTVKAIWYHPKFYDCDPKDWIRFIDTWDFDNSVPPNFKLMNWLNSNCGMNLHYKFEENDNALTINLNENEFLYDKKDILVDSIKEGYNLWDAAPCTGKTTFWNKIFETNTFDPISNNMLNLILTEPYNSICKSKFMVQANEGIVDIVVGSKRIKLTDVNNIITNYNHIVLMSQDQIEQTDILIVDESHLIFSEYYRYDILLKFLEWTSGFKKVLFMSGTPTIETQFFNNCNVVKINKPSNKTVTHEFLQWYPIDYVNIEGKIKIWNHFEPWNLSLFVHTLVKSGKKVYIYDSNISYQKCLKFKEMNNELNIAIYHKKELDDEGLGDIEYIDTNHRLGDNYDILISSCYFGVGNDLLDGDEGKYKKAAVILCGIHTPYEIFQVCSRWRNMEEINIYTIIDNQYYNEFEYDYNKVYEHERKKLMYEREDALNRDKSITLFGKRIRNISDSGIDFCALLKTNDICGKTIDFINLKLSEYGVNVDERIMPLVYDMNNYVDHIKYADALKLTRSNIRREFIKTVIDNYENLTSGKLNWNHTDSKIENWERICYKLANIYDIKTFKSELDHICAISNTDGYKLFINLYNARNNKDYNELYCLHWCYKNMITDDYMINEWISYNESIAMKSFVVYLSHVNKGDNYNLINRYNIKEYYDRWTKAIANFSISYCIKANYDILFAENIEQYTIDGKELTFGDLDISEYDKETERSKYAHRSYEKELLNELIFYHCNKQIIRNSNNSRKQIIITDKFKHPDKYKLKIGQIFASCNDLALYTKKSNQTVSKWMIKQWISKM